MGFWNQFNSADNTVNAPASRAEAIVPDASAPLTDYTRAIYVGGAGNVVVRLIDDNNDTTFIGVPVGTILPIRAAYVRNTSTATNMVALY